MLRVSKVKGEGCYNLKINKAKHLESLKNRPGKLGSQN